MSGESDVGSANGFEWNRDGGGPVDSTADGDETGELSSITNDDAGVALRRPPNGWTGDGDPTESSTWTWLTRATVFSALVLTFWTVPLALFGLVDGTGVEDAGFTAAVAVVGLFGLAAVVRIAVLPILLFRDASKLKGADDVDWAPSRTFYLATGALFATLACAYYLFKRRRHVGNPELAVSDELLYYEERRVPSNWHQVVATTVALAMSIGGAGLLLELLDAVSTDLAAAFFAPVILLVGLALLARFVLLPVALYKDAAAVRAADVDWNPNGALYAVVGYVLALPVVGLYLYRRHDRTGDLFDS